MNGKGSVLRYHLIQLMFVAFLLTVTFWCPVRAEQNEKLQIVTTTTDLASIARSVAGSHGMVKSIASGREDPHFIQAKPGYMLLARDADLWIRVGMDLEIGWEGPILDGSRNPSIRVGGAKHLDASEGVIKLDVPKVRVTRDMGDVHAQGNPHYWLDPLNARIVAGSICKRLCTIEPKYAKDFRQNLGAFRSSLDGHMFGEVLVAEYGGAKLWSLLLKGKLYHFLETRKESERLGGWLRKMKPFQGAKIVTYHRSWVYFTNRFGLGIAAELEPKPGIPPTPSHLADVIGRMKAEHVRAIVLAPYYGRKAAETVASKTGAKVLVCPISVDKASGITDYLSLMDHIVFKISEAL